MQKKFFAWLIATTLLISVPASNISAAEGGFTDIGNHWARALVQKFTGQGILAGYPDGTFRPDNHLQRAEAIALLNRFFNITESGYPTFSDVRPTDWHYHQIGAAQRYGYVSGFPDGTFRPNENISRLHAFIMIYRLLGSPQASHTDLSGFRDHYLIPTDMPIYRQIVSYMVGAGIVNAYPDNTLRVLTCITRAEMLSLLNKVSVRLADENQPYPEPTPTPEADRYPDRAPDHNGRPAPLPPGRSWWSSPGWLTTTPSAVSPVALFPVSSSTQETDNTPKASFMDLTFSEPMDVSDSLVLAKSMPLTEGYSAKENPVPTPSPAPNNNTFPSILYSGFDFSNSLSQCSTVQDFGVLENIFSSESGTIDVQQNAIVISDADQVHLNQEFTLPQGIQMELKNSRLVLLADLNISDRKDFIGDRQSEVFEQGGFLNIEGSGVLPSSRTELIGDSYYYDLRSCEWKAVK